MSDPAVARPLVETPPVRKGRSQLQEAMRRFRANPLAVASLAVLLLIVIACFIGPYLLPYGPEDAPTRMLV